jgi:hypothetical protein
MDREIEEAVPRRWGSFTTIALTVMSMEFMM